MTSPISSHVKIPSCFHSERNPCNKLIQLFHLRPTVITFQASYYISGQRLLHLGPVITFQANCYYIWGQLLHLRPIITLVASTGITARGAEITARGTGITSHESGISSFLVGSGTKMCRAQLESRFRNLDTNNDGISDEKNTRDRYDPVEYQNLMRYAIVHLNLLIN